MVSNRSTCSPATSFLRASIGAIALVAAGNATMSLAAEETDPGFLFILDASGSMWGRLDGIEKIVVARDVLRQVLEGLPESSPIGLQAYGHRSEGDCEDIEVIANVGELGRRSLLDEIDALVPKGKTPLTRSLESAGEMLREVEHEVSMILVSDGRDTCGGDPCAMAATLLERGIDMKIHVVGFDVDDEERAELGCIAAAGGGRYFGAGNAEQLLAALSTIGEETLAPRNAAVVFWLDTFAPGSAPNSGPVSSSRVLEKGESYSMTIDGTYNPWASPTRLCKGRSLGVADYPSARRTSCETVADVSYVYGISNTSPRGCSLELPHRLTGGVELSLDGGKTWANHQAIEDAPTADHRYSYELTGQGHPLMARFVDSVTNDNCGRFRFVLGEAGNRNSE